MLDLRFGTRRGALHDLCSARADFFRQCRPGCPRRSSARLSRFTWDASFGATGTHMEAGSGPGLTDLGQLSAGGATTLSVPGVPAGNYFVRVRATNAAGVSAASPDIVVTVGASCALPSAPTGLTAGVAGTAVTLQWSGTGPFRLEAGTAPGTSNAFAGDVGSATTLAASAPAGVYYARVHARNGCGLSLPSNEALIAVLVPDAPTALTVSTIRSTSRCAGRRPRPRQPATSWKQDRRRVSTTWRPCRSVGRRRRSGSPGCPTAPTTCACGRPAPDGVGPPSNELTLTVGPPGPGTSTVTFTGTVRHERHVVQRPHRGFLAI